MRRRSVVALVLVGVLLQVTALGVLIRLANPPPPQAPARWQPPDAVPRAAPLGADRLAFDSDRTGNFEIFVMGTDGSDPVQLTSDASFDSWGPRISPDRRTILFSRTPAGVHDRDPTATSLWTVASDGGSPTQLRPAGMDDWGLLGHAEWAPDGKSLVMVGGSRVNAQIFVTDPLGREPRAVTDRPGTNIDPAFTPDGKSIVFVGCPGGLCTPSRYEIYQVPVTGGEPKRLTEDRLADYDPMYAPNGRELAWLTNLSGGPSGVWDVRIRASDGSVRRLVGDEGITSRPQFSADGHHLFVHRIPPGGKRFDVFRVRPDGSELTNLTADQPGNNEYPSP